MDIRTTITKKGISKKVKRGGLLMHGGEEGQTGKQGGGVGQKIGTPESAVHICIIARVCLHLMNIVFRL